ncbi:MAG: hypothetical protein EOP21_01370 [Hyphomicrobiales bacterium]|nr:MAG: hypothetical protein EOP21_01370 [Hyphomicrobiales bacterium]
MAILYRHQALAELAAPIDVRGAFINTGAELDGLAAVARVFDTARQFIRIVDPYLDQTAVTTFAVLAAENIAVELLSDTRTVRPNLEPMARAFGNQHGATRPLSLRLAPPRALHDRLIVVDGQQVWSVTQSLKDLAAKDRLRRL